MLSNPVTYYVNGHETASFTYKPGSKPFHFSTGGLEITKVVRVNIILFADNVTQAADTVQRMLEFKIECMMEYDEWAEENKKAGITQDNTFRLYYTRKLLKMREHWQITPVPVNQAYIVGWAANDVI